MTIGHNNPPDPIDAALAPFGDCITEAENWLDGAKVENEGQMKAVDALTAEIKAALEAVKAGEESEAKPVYDDWKAIKARWKPTIDDLERIVKGLVGIGADFKKRLAEEKEAKRRAAWEAAKAAEREAARIAAAADVTNIEEQRRAAEAKQAAIDAEAAARDASRDTVKGLRKTWHYEIENHRTVLNWIAQNDRDALTAFIEEYVRRNHRDLVIEGVRVWQTKEAF